MYFVESPRAFPRLLVKPCKDGIDGREKVEGGTVFESQFYGDEDDDRSVEFMEDEGYFR